MTRFLTGMTGAALVFLVLGPAAPAGAGQGKPSLREFKYQASAKVEWGNRSLEVVDAGSVFAADRASAEQEARVQATTSIRAQYEGWKLAEGSLKVSLDEAVAAP